MKSLGNWKKNTAFLKSCLIFVWLIGVHILNPRQVTADRSGFISIDCGARADYVDEKSGISYETDENYIGSGTNNRVFQDVSFDDHPTVNGQLKTLRSFPNGERNCYTLKPSHQSNENKNQKQNYLIRALFAYGNYDSKNLIPVFDLYLGVNFWTTVRLPNSSFFMFYEIIIHHQQQIYSSNDEIQVCLVNTGLGTPIINTLELRPLNNSVYSNNSSLPLSLKGRFDIGSGLPRTITRYKDDVYDRLWIVDDVAGLSTISTTEIIVNKDSPYNLPPEVLSTASQPMNNSQLNYLSVNYSYESYDVSYEYLVFLHFAEIQKLPAGHKRIINVIIGDNYSSSHSLDYLKPLTLTSQNPTKHYTTFTINVSAQSDAPPILNAFEIYQLVPQPYSPTQEQDVNVIMDIKGTYEVSRISWQGDPCVPSNFTWDGLKCSFDNNPRIISLNLSSSKLTGQISSSFGKLEKLESLDLSYNEFTGQLPEFFAALPNLKFLVANNPGLCLKDSCKEHKFVIPLIASIGVLVIIIMGLLLIWRFRSKIFESSKTRVPKKRNRTFSYSQILHITKNFETTLGEGGFGKVYLGTLDDNTEVAVKLLSSSSKQGYKEFQSEAQLLTIIHHRNLVSLIGYCDEDNVKALIYEYMDKGDLSQLLSEKNSNVLKWSERLQVAVDAAKGLEYLHNGCKTPIIHRDLKPSNILLNKYMVAKIADFGLSRAFTNEIDSHISTQPAGTPGYIDPEFHRSGILNKKSDIYSFGIILLQLVTGQPPIRREFENVSFILDWVRARIDCGDIQGIVDPRLCGEFGVASAWKVVETAMACVLPQSSQRPEISYVLQELQECLALEMDHVGIDKSRTNNSLIYTGDFDSITILSAR